MVKAEYKALVQPNMKPAAAIMIKLIKILNLP
nr:MAG TPA: hypothetical protein [Caudoviricetes sp.]